MNKKKGTTLVELIAAIAIMALMMIAMYNIFEISNRLFYKNSMHLAIQQAASDSISSITGNIHKSEDVETTTSPAVHTGETFLCDITVNVDGGKRKYTYYVTNTESDQHKLVLYQTDLGVSKPRRVVSDNIKTVKVIPYGNYYYVSVTAGHVMRGNHFDAAQPSNVNLAESVSKKY